MKIFTTIIFLLFAGHTMAQSADSTKQENPVYVVDGKIDQSDRDVKPADIMNTSILSSSDATRRYGKQGANGAVVIVTKKYAIQAYRDRLKTLSDKYKKYMQQKHDDDSNLSYVLNDIIMDMTRKSSIQELYQLPVSNIKKVQFKRDSHFKTDATIVITTNEKLEDLQ